jgi:hypothetical protein
VLNERYQEQADLQEQERQVAAALLLAADRIERAKEYVAELEASMDIEHSADAEAGATRGGPVARERQVPETVYATRKETPE